MQNHAPICGRCRARGISEQVNTIIILKEKLMLYSASIIQLRLLVRKRSIGTTTLKRALADLRGAHRLQNNREIE
jgi:hypothetical protein